MLKLLRHKDLGAMHGRLALCRLCTGVHKGGKQPTDKTRIARMAGELETFVHMQISGRKPPLGQVSGEDSARLTVRKAAVRSMRGGSPLWASTIALALVISRFEAAPRFAVDLRPGG